MAFWDRIFRRREKTIAVDKRIIDQRRESRETLQYVKAVLARKDELLAEAVNQTGTAVRHKRRAPR